MEKSPIEPIVSYFHCKQCFESDDVERQKASGLLAAGMTRRQLVQVYCERCNEVVYQEEAKHHE